MYLNAVVEFAWVNKRSQNSYSTPNRVEIKKKQRMIFAV
jgi:hypothetical protein